MKWLRGRAELELKLMSILLLALIAAGLGYSAFSLRQLNTSYSMDQFMPADHPLYASDRLIRKTFRLNEEEPLIVYLKLDGDRPGSWLEPARLKVIEEATRGLAEVDGIRRVTSISNVQLAMNTEKGIRVDNLLSLVPPTEWKSRMESDALLSPGLLSRSGRVATLVADIGSLTGEEVDRVVKDVRTRVGIVAAAAGAEVAVSGMVALENDMANLVSKELQNFLLFAFLACLLTLVAYFRSLSGVLICMLLVGAANIISMACLVFAKINFSLLSTSLPVLASITALAIGAHTLLVFSDNWKTALGAGREPSKAAVILDTYRFLLLPNFLMALTTIIGFATMISSRVPLISAFSRSVSLGILASWAVITLALPALMYLFPVPIARKWTAGKARWALWVLGNRRAVMLCALLLTGFMAAHGMRLNWAVRLYDDLPSAGGIRDSAELIDHDLGGMIPLDVMVRVPAEESPWNDPGRMAKLTALLASWRQDPVVGSAIGLPDFVRAGFLGEGSRKAIAETLFLYSFSGEDNPVTSFLSSDGASTRLSLRLRDVSADRMQDFIARANMEARAAFPGAEVSTGGIATLAHPLNAELSSDLILGLWQSLAWISLLLLVVFRSFRLAVVAALPNLLAPLVLLTTMAVLRTPVKPVVAIIFSIALGIAYNNTVYLMSRMRKLERRFADVSDIVQRTWYLEGNPCLFSSLALFGGFAIFLSSYFSLNRTFGAYMLWSIGVGLVGDLVILPAMLRMFPWLAYPAMKEG